MVAAWGSSAKVPQVERSEPALNLRRKLLEDRELRRLLRGAMSRGIWRGAKPGGGEWGERSLARRLEWRSVSEYSEPIYASGWVGRR